MTPAEAIELVTTALAQVSGLRAPTSVPGAISPPMALTEIATIRSPDTFDRAVTYGLRVALLVQRGDQRNSQERTLELADPTGSVSSSVFAALLSMDNGGTVVFEGPGLVEHGGASYVGGVFTVEVFG